VCIPGAKGPLYLVTQIHDPLPSARLQPDSGANSHGLK
jgi:hypothetical protein